MIESRTVFPMAIQTGGAQTYVNSGDEDQTFMWDNIQASKIISDFGFQPMEVEAVETCWDVPLWESKSRWSLSPFRWLNLKAMGPSEVLEVGESCCDEAGRSVLAGALKFESTTW